MKKLIPAICMLLIAASLLGTSTFAWFSMNNKVTVTGMEVRTKVGSSLYIAEDNNTTLAKKSGGDLVTNYVKTVTGILEPASTVDGLKFFYTNSSNVKADGDAKVDSYIEYDQTAAKLADSQAAFKANYGDDATYMPFLDYVFQIRAVNSNGTNDAYINLTKLQLTYGGKDELATEKAWRVAIFVEDLNTTAGGAANGTADIDATIKVPTLKYDTTDSTAPVAAMIYSVSGAANFTEKKAVASATTLGAVAPEYNLSSGVTAFDSLMKVSKASTAQYKVVVRLWLEGEDKTCNNTTYANLTDAWALDLAFELDDSADKTGKTTVSALTLVASTASKTDLSGSLTLKTTVEDGAKVIDGITYNLIDSKNLYTKDATVTSSSRIYSIDSENHVTDVTNTCKLPEPAVTP